MKCYPFDLDVASKSRTEYRSVEIYYDVLTFVLPTRLGNWVNRVRFLCLLARVCKEKILAVCTTRFVSAHYAL